MVDQETEEGEDEEDGNEKELVKSCLLLDSRYELIGLNREMLDVFKIIPEEDFAEDHIGEDFSISFDLEETPAVLWQYYTRSMASWDYKCNAFDHSAIDTVYEALSQKVAFNDREDVLDFLRER